MGKELFLIQLDNPSGVYYAGQNVTGRVDLELPDELKVSAINLVFNGYSNVYWTEHHGSGKNRHTRHYSNNESYVNTQICLVGKALTGLDSVIIPPGKYSYPFNFLLPPGIPSSYEAHIGRVRYFLQADMKIPWAFDKHTRRMITVVQCPRISTGLSLQNGASKEDQKTLCCLCCESDPISAYVAVDRIGYVPGEAITFRSEINNKSDREMTCSKAQIVMAVSYHAHGGKTRTVRNIVNEMLHGRIGGGGTDVWMNEEIHIPAVPPSFLSGCNIIDIRYYVAMVVNPSGLAFSLYVPVEVIIGSIPLMSVAQQYGVTIPPTPSAPPPPYPGTSQGLYAETAMPNAIPHASMAESAMGRVSTRENGDTEHTTVNSDFAPVYTYYNWNKPDPHQIFTVQMDEN